MDPNYSSDEKSGWGQPAWPSLSTTRDSCKPNFFGRVSHPVVHISSMELAIALDGLRRNLIRDSLQPIVICQEDFIEDSHNPLWTNPPGQRFVKCNVCNDKKHYYLYSIGFLLENFFRQWCLCDPFYGKWYNQPNFTPCWKRIMSSLIECTRRSHI